MKKTNEGQNGQVENLKSMVQSCADRKWQRKLQSNDDCEFAVGVYKEVLIKKIYGE